MDWRFAPKVAAAVAVLTLGLATDSLRAAEANPPNARLRIDYAAPSECPGGGEFEARVWQRVRQQAPASESLEFSVDISLLDSSGSARGVLNVRDPNGAGTWREIAGASCEEVVDGLALIMALIVESGALPDAPKEDAASTPRTEPNSGSTDSAAAAAAAERPADGPDAALRPATTRARMPGGVDLSFALSALAASGMSPRVRPGGQLQIRVALARWPLMAGVMGRLTAPTTLSGEQGSARFGWGAAALALCSGPRVDALRSHLWFCAIGELGAIAAAGRDTERPQDETRLWGALGPGLLVATTLTRPLRLQAGLEGLVPLTRDRFLLGEQVIYSPARIGLRAHLGIAFQF